MTTADIIAEAKKRLAELDAEREKLLRMIAAAEDDGLDPAWRRALGHNADYSMFDLSTSDGWAAAALRSYSDRMRRSRGLSS